MFDILFDLPARLLSWLYVVTDSYIGAIAIIAAIVMLLVTPLNLKSTRGMLEMQKMQPLMREVQNQYGDDRQKLAEEQMKLYREYGVSPMSSCLPMLATMPVFIIMFRVLTGLTYRPTGANELLGRAVLRAAGAAETEVVGFLPRYLDHTSGLYQSLVRKTEMTSLGLDLSLSPAQMLQADIGKGLIYACLVAFLGLLYLFQQRMVSARATSPGMSPAMQRMMQYMPVMFAAFQVFFLLALVIYYIVQTVLRILQQAYITRRFYSGENSLGVQAQAAGERARKMAAESGDGGGFLQRALEGRADEPRSKASAIEAKSKPVPKKGPAKTPPSKSRTNRPASSGKASSNRPSGGKKRRKKR